MHGISIFTCAVHIRSCMYSAATQKYFCFISFCWYSYLEIYHSLLFGVGSLVLGQWYALQWRHDKCDRVSNRRRLHCLLNCWSGADQRKHRSSASLAFVREIHRLQVGSPHKKASNAENISIWWRHHDFPFSMNWHRCHDKFPPSIKLIILDEKLFR